MELAMRLRLGKLAGGMEIKGAVSLQDPDERSRDVSPLEAAMLGCHEECVELLRAHGATQ